MPSDFSRRSQRKRQTRLTFDPVEPSSSLTMSPARMRHQISSSPSKAFDLTSPARMADGIENNLIPSGKKYAVIIETPKKQKDGALPFKPLATPVESSQTQTWTSNETGEFTRSIFVILHRTTEGCSVPCYAKTTSHS
jgi:hypothetical protein